MGAGSADQPLSERIERSPTGRLVLSVLVVLVLLGEVGTHLPASAIQRAVEPSAVQTVRLLASEQAWGVFAPNPRSTSLGLRAEVHFADGTSTVWELPTGTGPAANLRYYRWRKWLERVRADEYQNLWEPTARWIAGLYDSGPAPVTRVDLIRRFRDNAVTGDQPLWQEFVYYSLDLDGDGS
jgi:hypothetical protein